MHQELVDALVKSQNEAADDLLLEGLRVGAEIEQSIILNALFHRKTVRGLSGVVELYEELPERLQTHVLSNIKVLHHALRECGRSDRSEMRQSAMRMIARSRQCKLAYVLTENLHDTDEALSKSAVDAVVGLAQWVATSTRMIQKDYKPQDDDEAVLVPPAREGEPAIDYPALYRDLMDQRPEIETVVARAMDVHRGKYAHELLRAALLLCDSPQSKTLAILHTAKHGGQSPMVRRLQQGPAAEHVEAFLLGATHGQLRLHFGNVMAHIEETPVLDAVLRKTHWLKDHHLQLCMHQVTRGIWWQESELMRDLEAREPEEACKIGDWLAASGMHDLMQDERFLRLNERATGNVAGRLRLLRTAMNRRKPASVQFLRAMLVDGDERLVRMAAREIVRRRPVDFENMLLQLMTTAPLSVRRVVSRAIGHAGFEQFWQRFDRLDRNTRRQAGRAMLKLLPDAAQRLGRRLMSGPVNQRLKALQITQELALADTLRDAVTSLVSHPHPKVRSKAVSVLGEMPTASIDLIMERVLNDNDSRVRANAIEVLETRQTPKFIPLLAERAKTSNNRERANAIKALNHMKVGNVGPSLLVMLQDPRPEHRISGMWALREMGLWKLLQEVGRIAKDDQNLRCRRYAVAVLKGVAEMVHASKGVG